jgi:hypothetical protein
MDSLMHSLDFLVTHADNKQKCRKTGHVENVLTQIFYMDINNIKLSTEEKKSIAIKIKKIIPLIDSCIFCLGNVFNPNRGKLNLIMRSGIQFLLDELKLWPTDNGYLENDLKFILHSDSVETFDDALENWRQHPYTFAVDVIHYTDEELKAPPNVPPWHTWW